MTLQMSYITVGGKLETVKCCGEHPLIELYTENYHMFKVDYKCQKCNNVGSFGMVIPKIVRKKELLK